MIRKMILKNKKPGAAIASSVDSSAHIILPPGFESEEHHLRFYLIGIVKFVLYLLCEKNENKQKRGRLWPIFLKKQQKTVFIMFCRCRGSSVAIKVVHQISLILVQKSV